MNLSYMFAYVKYINICSAAIFYYTIANLWKNTSKRNGGYWKNTGMDKKELREQLGTTQHFHPEKNPHGVGTPPKHEHFWDKLHMKPSQPMPTQTAPTNPNVSMSASGTSQTSTQKTEAPPIKRIDSKNVYMGIDFSD